MKNEGYETFSKALLLAFVQRMRLEQEMDSIEMNQTFLFPFTNSDVFAVAYFSLYITWGHCDDRNI